MEHSKLFLKGRTIAFAVVTLVCFVWVILFSVFLSLRWEISNQTERSFVALFMTVDVITMIMLPILILREFRPWLDALRLTLLLLCHIGLAVAFCFQFQQITCLDKSLDGPGVCQLFNVYIVMASWVVPALLLIYAGCLGAYHWHYTHHPPTETGSEFTDDEESLKPKRGDIPIMAPIHDLPSLSHNSQTKRPLSEKAQLIRPPSHGRSRSLSASASQRHQSLPPAPSFPATLTPYRVPYHQVDTTPVAGRRHHSMFPHRQSEEGFQTRAPFPTSLPARVPADTLSRLTFDGTHHSQTPSRQMSQVPARVSATWGWGTPFRPSATMNSNSPPNRSPHDSLASSRRPSESLIPSSLHSSDEIKDESGTGTSKKARHESKRLTKIPDPIF
ncbi:hypothetical protein OF83DRAFT_1112945 [Amylostereum chailletii]|nr:hypothetical protein OF83DRAFT_1112945 [Amylostereum chailletii]